jgi:hypothetical protein
VNPAFVTNGGTARILGPPPVETPPASAVSLTIGGASRVIVDGPQSALSIDSQISVQNGELDVSGDQKTRSSHIESRLNG